MANLDSLGYTSITEMTPVEGTSFIMQVRERRRTAVKQAKPKAATNSVKPSRAARQKAVKKLSATDAAELLKLLGGLP